MTKVIHPCIVFLPNTKHKLHIQRKWQLKIDDDNNRVQCRVVISSPWATRGLLTPGHTTNKPSQSVYARKYPSMQGTSKQANCSNHIFGACPSNDAFVKYLGCFLLYRTASDKTRQVTRNPRCLAAPVCTRLSKPVQNNWVHSIKIKDLIKFL